MFIYFCILEFIIYFLLNCKIFLRPSMMCNIFCTCNCVLNLMFIYFYIKIVVYFVVNCKIFERSCIMCNIFCTLAVY